MIDDKEKNDQLVKAKTSRLQLRDTNIVSRGLSDLALLDVEGAKIADEDSRQSQARRWIDIGFKQYFKGEYDDAIESYSKAIELTPNNVNGYLGRGLAYEEKDQYIKAIEDYGKVISLEPNNASLYTGRGHVYEEIGQYDKAIDDYKRAIALNPNDAQPYYYRGLAYEMKGNTVSAISDFQKACDLGSEIGCENLQRVLRQK